MYKLVDVRISESVDEWIKATIDEYGRLDGAVNMAGIISRTMPISNETDEIWDRVLSVNCRGNFVCLRSQIRAMKDGGSIVSGPPQPQAAPLTPKDNRQRILTFDSRSLQQAFGAKWALQGTPHIVLAKQP